MPTESQVADSRIPWMHVTLAKFLKIEIAFDDGIKLKNGMWTPPMSYYESFALLTAMVGKRGEGPPPEMQWLAPLLPDSEEGAATLLGSEAWVAQLLESEG